MPSVFPYVAQVVTKSYCPNLLYFHLGLCGQYHMCVHLQCIIQSQVHSYPFSSDFSLLTFDGGFRVGWHVIYLPRVCIKVHRFKSFFPPDRTYLLGFCTEYLLEHSVRTLKFSMECPGTCINHVLSPFGLSFILPGFFSCTFQRIHFWGRMMHRLIPLFSSWWDHQGWNLPRWLF